MVCTDKKLYCLIWIHDNDGIESFNTQWNELFDGGQGLFAERM